MDKKLPTHRPKTLNALKAVLPIMAMAAPLANASIRPASISRNGLNTRAAISQYEKADTGQKSQAFGAFGNSHYVKPASRQVDSEALAFLSENNFLAGGENVVGDTSGDISGLTGRKSFLSCVTAGGAPAYYTTGDPIISDSICTILGYTWTDGDNLPPVFPKDNPGVFLTDISLAVGGNITLDFEIEDPPITGANYLDVINVTVSSDNQSAIRNADISVTRDPGTSPGNLFYLTIANVVGQGGANITVTATDANNNSTSDSFFVNTGAVPSMANSAVAITVLEDSGSNAVSTSNFAASDSDSGQTLTWSASGGTKGTPQASGTASTPTTNGTPSSVTYTPTTNLNGSDTFTVIVSDGSNTDSRTVNVTITPVNDQPTVAVGGAQTVGGSGVGGAVQTVAGFASMSSPGGGTDEAGQTISDFIVTESSDTNNVVSGVDISNTGVLTYTPASGVEGTATINVQVVDSGGTTNGGVNTSALAQFTITVDTLSPVLTETTPVSTPTADTTPSLTFNLSEAGTLNISNNCGSPQEGAVSAGSVTVSLSQEDNSTPFGDGTYACLASVTDAAGNVGGLMLTPFNVVTDSVAPTVSAVNLPSDGVYVAGQTLDFSVNFDETLVVDTASGTPSLGLTIGATDTAASLVSATGSSLLFRYTVGTGNEDTDGIAIGVINTNSGSIQDAAGNDANLDLGVLGSTAGVRVDAIAPSVVVSGASGFINAPFTATITFSESVVGFDVGDIYSPNATLSDFSGSGAVYTVLVTPNAEGIVVLEVADTVAVDAAGNSNSAGPQLQLTYDATAPTAVISGASGDINAAFTATVTFSESITGFDLSDIIAVNASLSDFAGSGSTYTVLVTPNIDGPVTVDVAAAVATDGAGNGNTAAAQLTATYDGSAPTVVIGGASGSINTPFTATLTFSESVSGFDVSDVGISNALLSDFAGSGAAYTVLVTPNADGAVTLDVAASTASDSAGNGNTAAAQLAVTYDATIPTLTLDGASGDINAPFTANMIFSESVSGFDLSDVQVTNATLSDFSGSGASYSVLVTPTADGVVTLDVSADAALDAAGNANSAATQLLATYDGSAPTVAISGASGAINTAFTATIAFSESVSGFDVSDLGVSNALLSDFAGSGASYTVLVTPNADGALTLDVAAAVAQDVAGNDNSAATQLTATYDATAPTAVISGASGYINAAFTATITFSESVNDFVVGDIAVSNATLADFSGSGDTYSVLVTPTTDGAVTLDVAANAAQDAAGNNSAAAAQLAVTYDAIAPTVLLTAPATLVNAAFTATITFSENVTDFVVADISASNATLSDFSGSGTSYTVLVTPTTDGTVTLDVVNAVAVDVAGNSNNAAGQLVVTYDATAPTVALTTAATLVNEPFTVTATFSEMVTGVELADFVVTNGTAGNLAALGNAYSVLITPTADGDVTVNMAAGAASDAAGNTSTAAVELTTSADTTGATTTLTGVPSSAITAFDVTVTFSENVSTLTSADITVTNGVVTQLLGGGTGYTATIMPTASGADTTVSVAADVVTDDADNGNQASAVATVAIVNDVGVASISGVAAEGETLTADIADNNGLANATIQYQWTSGGEVAGSDQDTYLITASDVGNVIGLTVSYTDDLMAVETPVAADTATVISLAQVALNTISSQADASGSTPATITEYDTAGVTSVTATVLDLINNAIARSNLADVNELSEVQALVDIILEGQDDDGDGLPNMLEGDDTVDTDGDGIADRDDADSDNDGISDLVELNLDLTDTDNDGIIDAIDADIGNDGIVDTGLTDDNLDGVNDAMDELAEWLVAFASTDQDGDGLLNMIDLDADNDGLFDVAEAGLGDQDGDALLDDGVDILTDVIQLPDSDGDTLPDYLDVRSNGVDTDFSNSNLPSDLDGDLDGVLDSTTDVDRDGIMDVVDNAIGAFGSRADFDGDGIPNHLDDDDDGDGISDADENPQQAFFTGEDADADGIDDGVDANVNGVLNGEDLDGNGVRDDREMPDLDGDGFVDHLDADADGDGIPDNIDPEIALPVDAAPEAPGAGITDADGDGVDDSIDPSINTGVDVETSTGGGSMSLGLVFGLALLLVALRQRRFSATVMAALLATSVSAQAGEWSVEGGVGVSQLDPKLNNNLTLSDDSDSSWQLSTAYHFNREWAAQLRYVDMGNASIGNGRINYQALAAMAQYRPDALRMGRWTPQLQLGMGRLFNDSQGGLNLKSHDDLRLMVGAGIDCRLNKTDYLEAQVNSYAEDARVWTLGFRHHF
ncbi:MAG: Ig-like domain-containing protein [Thalassolituus sp.]|uniref:beta strand repeat-containing protein n=1 Tax=Thalassolituus sp. TaxID=2030822 RepID=UPI0039826E32